jgi:hypothetical protein
MPTPDRDGNTVVQPYWQNPQPKKDRSHLQGLNGFWNKSVREKTTSPIGIR